MSILYKDEIEFENLIKEKTGKELGEDYGFIMGRCTPFHSSAFQASSVIDGFTIWKKNGNIVKELNISPSNQEEYVKKIVEFLNS